MEIKNKEDFMEVYESLCGCVDDLGDSSVKYATAAMMLIDELEERPGENLAQGKEEKFKHALIRTTSLLHAIQTLARAAKSELENF